MGCLKGKKKLPEDEAKFSCKKCGATSDSKKNICKPKKLKCKNCSEPCDKKHKEEHGKNKLDKKK